MSKVPDEFKNHPKFQPVPGDVSDGSTLDFSGCDAVITMTPPKLDGSDFIAFGKAVANNVRRAVERSGSVKRVVYVSSQGAQYPEGVVSSAIYVIRGLGMLIHKINRARCVPTIIVKEF